jgi:serine protease Do
MLVGSVSGFVGGIYVQKYAKQLLSITQNKSGSGSIVQTAGSNSAVNVFKTANPAVVSITISQKMSDVSNNSQSFNFPFGLSSPYFNFAFPNDNGSSNNSGNDNQSTNGNADNYQEVAAGSGFFVTSDGLILTNKHVVSTQDAKYSVTTSDGKSYDATVVATDPVSDLALVKIDLKNTPALQFANSSDIQIGEEVIAIGNSLGQYQNTVTSGIISGIGRSITASSDEGSSEELDGVLQTDAAINPGNSGGPLLDSSGKVVGVNTAINQQGELLGFAIPSNSASRDIQIYQKQGKIIKPFLGISYVEINPSVQSKYNLSVNYGAYITASNGVVSVVKGSAADKAGLKDGDIIISVNDQKISTIDTLAQLLQQYDPGQMITLTVIRGGKQIQIQATLGTAQQ